MLLEAQDHMKAKLFASLGPSFATCSMMSKLSSNPSGLLKELNTASSSGTLTAFLAPRPTSALLPPIQTGPVNPSIATIFGANGIGSNPTTPTTTPRTAPALSEASRSTSPIFTVVAHQQQTQQPTHLVQHQDYPGLISTSAEATTPSASSPPSVTPLAFAASSPTVSSSTLDFNHVATVSTPINAAPTAISPPERARTGFVTASPSSSFNLASQPSSHVSNFMFGQIPPFIPNSTPLTSSTGSPPPPLFYASTPASTSTAVSPNPPTSTSLQQNQATLSPRDRAKLTASPPGAQLSSSSSAVAATPGANSSSPPPGGIGSLTNGGSSGNLERRAHQHRGSIVDETLTSARAKAVQQQPLSPMSAKASSSNASRMNMSQLVGAVRDKVGLAKKDKEKKEREKYFDPLTNAWMLMDSPTLDDLINDPSMMIIYYDFLRTIHAEENLVAWVEIELYKGSVAAREARRNAGVDLLVRYFEPTSKTLINIEGVNYKDILKELNERPSRDLFDVAQRVLWDQLAFQCYVRFKDSENMRRILTDEPTVKGKKKELQKAAQKALKANVEAAPIFAKLEELSKYRAGQVAFVPNVSEREFQMEDVLYSSDLLIAFREYLNTLTNSPEYLDALSFWFEVEVWKNSSKDNFKETAVQLLRDYLLPPVGGGVPRVVIPGLDVKSLEQELNERPDKNTFIRHQAFVWRKLKLEQFSNFESSETLNKFLDGNLPMRQMQPIVRHCDTLNELRAKNANESLFKANTAKVQTKIRVKRQEVQGNGFELEYMLTDREYVQILCEFLDKRQARENLAFWTEAEYYKYIISPTEKAQVANKIWDRFFSDKADVLINVDVSEKSAIQQALKEPNNLPVDLFGTTQDTIYTLIAYDLIPKFSSSEQGAKLLKAAKRRPPHQPIPSFRAGGVQAVRDLRSWLENE